MSLLVSENLVRWRNAVLDVVHPMRNAPIGFTDDPEIGYIEDQPITLRGIMNAVIEAKDARSGVGIKLPNAFGFSIVPENFVNFLGFRADQMAAQGALQHGPDLRLLEAAMAVRDRNDARLEDWYPGHLAEVTERRPIQRVQREEIMMGLLNS